MLLDIMGCAQEGLFWFSHHAVLVVIGSGFLVLFLNSLLLALHDMNIIIIFWPSRESLIYLALL